MSKKIKFEVEENDLKLVDEVYNEVFLNNKDVEYVVMNGKGQCIDIAVNVGMSISICLVIHTLKNIEWEKVTEFFEKLKNKNAKVKIKNKEVEIEAKNISQENLELIINNILKKELD